MREGRIAIAHLESLLRILRGLDSEGIAPYEHQCMAALLMCSVAPTITQSSAIR